jgi:hypothetical protein
MTTASPTSAAERMRRYRERRREGLRGLLVELRGSVTALMREAETHNDSNAIADALYEYLERTLDPAA